MSTLFSELPEFLKEYIHENRWESFRRIQEDAFDNMMLSEDDIIISSGTSSGKTEAALFPVIASLYDEPSKSIGALYISPLKALINDQYSRISRILERSGITVTGWHGDVDRYIKDRLKEDPKGILQMTPESLQALIGGDPDSARRMFPDLRFVIIDEMHAFMDSERGLQLLCCLDRIERISSCHPRILVLSATI
ncbi:MAG: DEAD/DEAH box helicase, partial [Candidatus Methanomethylophilaceae archaeon]|nr:DEAD/DEAH box helicase [Candidatus Methanomethylophilaceae archaeon]